MTVGVVDCDFGIALEHVAGGAVGGGVAGVVGVLFVGPIEDVFQLRERIETVLFECLRRRGFSIEGADLLADVAAKDPVADGFVKFRWDRVAELDGEVGDAAGGVHFVGCREGVGRAGVEAGGALATMVGDGSVGLEAERGDDFAQEEVAAEGPGA